MTSILHMPTNVGYLAVIIVLPDTVRHTHGYIKSHTTIDEPARGVVQGIQAPEIARRLVEALLDGDSRTGTILARALQLSLLDGDCDYIEVQSVQTKEGPWRQLMAFGPPDLSRPLNARLAEHKTFCEEMEAAIEDGWLPPTLRGEPVDED